MVSEGDLLLAGVGGFFRSGEGEVKRHAFLKAELLKSSFVYQKVRSHMIEAIDSPGSTTAWMRGCRDHRGRCSNAVRRRPPPNGLNRVCICESSGKTLLRSSTCMAVINTEHRGFCCEVCCSSSMSGHGPRFLSVVLHAVVVVVAAVVVVAGVVVVVVVVVMLVVVVVVVEVVVVVVVVAQAPVVVTA